jgi:hypothetical protein
MIVPASIVRRLPMSIRIEIPQFPVGQERSAVMARSRRNVDLCKRAPAGSHRVPRRRRKRYRDPAYLLTTDLHGTAREHLHALLRPQAN